MRRPLLPSLLTFASGCLFATALLVRCTDPVSGGVSRNGDAGSMTMGPGSAMAGDNGTSLFQQGSRLKFQIQQWEDGTSWPSGMFVDTKFNELCFLQTATDGKSRCLPNAAVNNGFSDASCTHPILYLFDWTPPRLTVKHGRTFNQDLTNTITDLGAEQSGAVYVKSGSGCTPVAGHPGLAARMFEVGALTPPETFVALAGQ